MSVRKGLANILRAVAKELDPGGEGGNVDDFGNNVVWHGSGLNFSAESEIPSSLSHDIKAFDRPLKATDFA